MKTRQKGIAAAELPVNDDPTESSESNPPIPDDDLEYLKTALIHRCNRDELTRKLNSTRDLRKILLTQTETDLRHRFPFFFAEPELVSNVFDRTAKAFYTRVEKSDY